MLSTESVFIREIRGCRRFEFSKKAGPSTPRFARRSG